jgi:hypothetical protein
MMNRSLIVIIISIIISTDAMQRIIKMKDGPANSPQVTVIGRILNLRSFY